MYTIIPDQQQLGHCGVGAGALRGDLLSCNKIIRAATGNCVIVTVIWDECTVKLCAKSLQAKPEIWGISPGDVLAIWQVLAGFGRFASN